MGNTLQKLRQNQSEQNQEHELQVIELPDEPQNFTCEICIEPMLLPDKKFKNQNLCVHPFCTDCIIKYITVKLDDNIGDIPCPSLNCKNFLDPISCRNLVGAELFVKWCDVFCESAVLGLAHCYCPNQNCSVLILDECGGNAKRSKCPNCKSLFCFQCKLPWHDGLRCGEQRDENDVAFRVVAKRNKWKRCPQCHHFVERIEGCRSINCRCGATFCYKCGGRIHARDGCACDFMKLIVFFLLSLLLSPLLLLYLPFRLIWDFCCPCSRSSEN